MRKIILVAVGALACLVPAQDSASQQSDLLAASRNRLEKALQKTAALQDTAFEAAWGPAKKKAQQKAQNENPFAVLVSQSQSGMASGSWHPTMSICRFDSDEGDEFVTVGRRTLARSGDLDWAIRSRRYADGNTVNYLPDVEVLLQQLDEWQLAVVHREVGSIDDRPVEIITVTLNADQVAEAVWSGAVPAAIAKPGFGANVFNFAIGGMGGGGRKAAPKPKAVVDLAIAIDPATSLVQRLSFRAYVEQNQRGMAGPVIVVQGGAGGILAEEEEEEDEEEEEGDESGPMQFENGLPQRSRKKKTVSDLTVTLSRHGQATAPELTDQQKKLLRR